MGIGSGRGALQQALIMLENFNLNHDVKPFHGDIYSLQSVTRLHEKNIILDPLFYKTKKRVQRDNVIYAGLVVGINWEGKNGAPLLFKFGHFWNSRIRLCMGTNKIGHG